MTRFAPSPNTCKELQLPSSIYTLNILSTVLHDSAVDWVVNFQAQALPQAGQYIQYVNNAIVSFFSAFVVLAISPLYCGIVVSIAFRGQTKQCCSFHLPTVDAFPTLVVAPSPILLLFLFQTRLAISPVRLKFPHLLLLLR